MPGLSWCISYVTLTGPLHPVHRIGGDDINIVPNVVDGKNVQDILAGRTLQTLSTQMPSTAINYRTFGFFHTYYGDIQYADKWAMGAILGQDVKFSTGLGDALMGNTLPSADYERDSKVAPEDVTWDYLTRKECGAKGTAYMSAWMMAIYMAEVAVDKCKANDETAAHSWDAGWAYYTGSLEGTEGRGTDGMMTWNLANKRCRNFKTCGVYGQSTDPDDIAKINRDLIDLWNRGEKMLGELKCDGVRNDIIPQITSKMAVPPIQGTLRYANFLDTDLARTTPYSERTLKQRAEGAVFFASVAPLFHQCSPEDTKTIYDNMKCALRLVAISSSLLWHARVIIRATLSACCRSASRNITASCHHPCHQMSSQDQRRELRQGARASPHAEALQVPRHHVRRRWRHLGQRRVHMARMLRRRPAAVAAAVAAGAAAVR